MIVGICGLKGSGKDTIADNLIKNHGFIKLSFAKIVKDIVAIMFGWERHLLEGDTKESRIFRETKCDFWSDKLNRDITPRKMLQEFGTDIIRNNFNENMWVYCVEKLIKDNKDKNIVITDCRFKNEIDMIRSFGGKIYHIYRDLPEWFVEYKNNKIDKPKDIHPSEYMWIREYKHYFR